MSKLTGMEYQCRNTLGPNTNVTNVEIYWEVHYTNDEIF